MSGTYAGSIDFGSFQPWNNQITPSFTPSLTTSTSTGNIELMRPIAHLDEDGYYIEHKKKKLYRLVPRHYNPYNVPDVDIPGPGFERKRISLIHVNRPTTFIIEHQTTATIQVTDKDGKILFPMAADPEKPYESWYYNFLLQGVIENRQEISQIKKMFGGATEFHMFGSSPLILQCAGVLLNTDNYRWGDQWLYAYENFLRGTKCVENNARVYLAYDRIIVSGYILSTTISRSSVNDKSIPMSFSFIVIDSMIADIPPLEELQFNVSSGEVYNYQTNE